MVSVAGQNLSEDLTEAVQASVISHLRAMRGIHIRALMAFGFTE